MLLRTSEIDEGIVKECVDILKYIFYDVYVDIGKEPIKIPEQLYNPYRKQYRAEGVAYFVSSFSKHDYYIIFLADVDAYVPGLNFVFGLAIPSIRTATVFTHRLRIWSNHNSYVLRIKKEVIHELGHLLGLNHCFRPTCVMKFSNSVLEVDEKSYLFCNKCVAKLESMGYKLRRFSSHNL